MAPLRLGIIGLKGIGGHQRGNTVPARQFHRCRPRRHPTLTTGASARRPLEWINGIILSGLRRKPVTFPLDRAEYDQLLDELIKGTSAVERTFT